MVASRSSRELQRHRLGRRADPHRAPVASSISISPHAAAAGPDASAAKVGPDADTLIDVILRSRPHPEQGFRSAIGILGLVKRYGCERVDAACARALLLNARSYKSVATILRSGTDKTAPPAQDVPILVHANIRGRGYYN
jgi:hypothetical protein